MGDFRKLQVWQKAHALALEVVRAATGIRAPHLGTLRNQLIRTALSIPTNIVEGSGQTSAAEFARFVRYAINSSNELEYHLLVADELSVIPPERHDSVIPKTIEVRKMLYGLLKGLK